MNLRHIIFLLLLAIFLGACASSVTPTDEQEGGITGTGNSIDCEDKENKKHEPCMK